MRTTLLDLLGTSILPERVGKIAATQLLDIGGKSVTVGMMAMIVALIGLSLLVAGLVQTAMTRAFRKRGVESTAYVTARLAHHLVLLIGVGVALDTAGIQLKALFAASAVFAVGIGFAMQNVAQNFVSGLILLLERSIKVGDGAAPTGCHPTEPPPTVLGPTADVIGSQGGIGWGAQM